MMMNLIKSARLVSISVQHVLLLVISVSAVHHLLKDNLI